MPGRELKGIHFAMEFLPQQNRVNAGDHLDSQILATGKHVIIIGGGDTGADCLGTSHRRRRSRSLSSRSCRCRRRPRFNHSVAALAAAAAYGKLARRRRQSRVGGEHAQVHRRRERQREEAACGSCRTAAEVRGDAGTEFELDADLVLLAMGFTGPVRNGLIEQLGVEIDLRGNVATDDNYQTTVPSVFAAGDMRRGQSLVVWAIAEGRKAARAIDLHLMGKTKLT